MIEQHDVELARFADASQIAVMSRDLIEHGLGWSWNRRRICAAIRNPDCNVAVIRNRNRLIGFGIMEYALDEAHLLLFAVHPGARRKHAGTQLLAWLEKTALIAGVQCINLETRADNHVGRRFYNARGYQVTGTVPGYYAGRENAVRMTHRLRAPPPWAGTA